MQLQQVQLSTAQLVCLKFLFFEFGMSRFERRMQLHLAGQVRARV